MPPASSATGRAGPWRCGAMGAGGHQDEGRADGFWVAIGFWFRGGGRGWA